MNLKSKILLRVEGEDTEPTILGNETHGLLSLIGADYEIVPFKNPIYELYDAYKKGEYDDIVSFLRANKNLEINDNILSKMHLVLFIWFLILSHIITNILMILLKIY